MRKRTKLRIMLFAIILVGAKTTCAQISECNQTPKLSDYDRGQFMAIAYGAKPAVYAHLLSFEGCQSSMLASLRVKRIEILFSDKRVGYALVSVSQKGILELLDVS